MICPADRVPITISVSKSDALAIRRRFGGWFGKRELTQDVIQRALSMQINKSGVELSASDYLNIAKSMKGKSK